MFRHRSATPAGVTGNGAVRSLGDNVTSILGSAVNARADTATASITAVGGQQSGRGQPGLRAPKSTPYLKSCNVGCSVQYFVSFRRRGLEKQGNSDRVRLHRQS
jgi:hypothetical protein